MDDYAAVTRCPNGRCGQYFDTRITGVLDHENRQFCSTKCIVEHHGVPQLELRLVEAKHDRW